jgi:hypothetical protein
MVTALDNTGALGLGVGVALVELFKPGWPVVGMRGKGTENEVGIGAVSWLEGAVYSLV